VVVVTASNGAAASSALGASGSDWACRRKALSRAAADPNSSATACNLAAIAVRPSLRSANLTIFD
jgi:hypothetical protein